MKNRSILVVEDNPEMQLLLSSILKSICDLQIVSNSTDAIQAIQQAPPTLIIADVELPGESGFQLCARLKTDNRFSQIPIIILTSHGNEANEVMGFSLGADDFIKKPFDRNTFIARIQAKLTNLIHVHEQQATVQSADLILNTSTHRLYRDSPRGRVEIPVTGTELKLLTLLLQNPERVLSREAILNHIWSGNLNVTDRVIDTHICSIRKKIKETAIMIESIAGIGYCLTLRRLRHPIRSNRSNNRKKAA